MQEVRERLSVLVPCWWIFSWGSYLLYQIIPYAKNILNNVEEQSKRVLLEWPFSPKSGALLTIVKSSWFCTMHFGISFTPTPNKGNQWVDYHFLDVYYFSDYYHVQSSCVPTVSNYCIIRYILQPPRYFVNPLTDAPFPVGKIITEFKPSPRKPAWIQKSFL